MLVGSPSYCHFESIETGITPIGGWTTKLQRHKVLIFSDISLVIAVVSE